ncbi:hypothetical protein IC575_000500 [Cucumis melo]
MGVASFLEAFDYFSSLPCLGFLVISGIAGACKIVGIGWFLRPRCISGFEPNCDVLLRRIVLQLLKEFSLKGDEALFSLRKENPMSHASWIPPTVGVWKLNINASWLDNVGASGIGWVVLDLLRSHLCGLHARLVKGLKFMFSQFPSDIPFLFVAEFDCFDHVSVIGLSVLVTLSVCVTVSDMAHRLTKVYHVFGSWEVFDPSSSSGGEGAWDGSPLWLYSILCDFVIHHHLHKCLTYLYLLHLHNLLFIFSFPFLNRCILSFILNIKYSISQFLIFVYSFSPILFLLINI